MAGAGKKTFTAGETLTASDVNTYLMEQSVMYFAGTAARSSAIPTPSTGMTSYIGVTGTATIPQLETYTGSAWQTPYGLTLVANVPISAASSVQLNNVFTSTYDSYVIVMTAKSTGSTSDITFKLTSVGTPTSTSGYAYCTTNLGFTASPSWILGGSAGDTSAKAGTISTLECSTTIFLHQPSAAKVKTFWHQGVRTDGYLTGGNGYANYTTAYDGIQFTFPTCTGQVRVYGLRNS